MESSAEHLIRELLTPNSSLRMGMRRGGVEDIKRHQWFSGFDWSALEAQTMRSPWTPRIRGHLDLSHFDEFDEEDSIPRYTGSQELFAGF